MMELQRSTLRSFVCAHSAAIIASGMVVAVSSVNIASAQAQSGDAKSILKSMSDYMAGQKAFSVKFDSNIEIITYDLQKIQFTTSGQVSVIRPNKMHSRRTGGYRDVETIYDGKTLTLIDRDNNKFAQLTLQGSIGTVLNTLRDKYAVIAPGADLLSTNVYEVLMANVINAKHIGRGVIGGVKCEHLAFRTLETDWQIWIEAGDRPIPRKLVVTSKTMTSAPQYSVSVSHWQSGSKTEEFAFKPERGASKVDIKDITAIDEIPPGIITRVGGKQ